MKYRCAGYTFTELMVCMAILGILTAMALFGAWQYRLRNEASECRGNIQLLYHALNEYALDFQLPRGATVQVAHLQPIYLPANLRLVCPATTGVPYGSNLTVGSVPRCPAGLPRHQWRPDEAPGL
ncbi:MAG: type II secretion system GspH family protein [bacterium]|nr:type II secretion system GspH family protein [bacterium]